MLGGLLEVASVKYQLQRRPPFCLSNLDYLMVSNEIETRSKKVEIQRTVVGLNIP